MYACLIQVLYFGAFWIFVSQYFKVAQYIPILRIDNIEGRLEQIKARRTIHLMINSGVALMTVSLTIIVLMLPAANVIEAFYALP